MPRHELLHLLAALHGLFFFFALGAVVGSFINVLAHRLPRGEGVVRPPSACPHCGTRLRWNDNIPILGWIVLRGKCRYCKSKISPQYPLVELAVALLFALPWFLWFMDTNVTEHLGLTRELRIAIAPEWTNRAGRSMFAETWPVFLVVLVMLGSLAAATVVDAKTFTIPMPVCWAMIAAGVVGHPIGAAVAHPMGWSGFDYAIPAVSGAWLYLALCGAIGVGVSNILLLCGVLPRSFADFSSFLAASPCAPEASASQTVRTDGASERADVAPVAPPGDAPGAPAGEPSVRQLLVRTVFLTGPAVAGMFLGFALGDRFGLRMEGMGIGAAGGLVIGVVLRNLAVRGEAVESASEGGDAAGLADDPSGWMAYPHARREMAKEALFVAPIVALMVVGFWAGAPGGPLAGLVGSGAGDAGGPALWVRALGGSLLGYLVGGGVVWAVRMLGTLAFGQEAMGLGDVHLLAGVGACLGWIDPLLAFFVAPFFGLAWAVGARAASRVFRMSGAALPYGPHLAAAAVLVVLGKPWFEWGLVLILNEPVDLP